MVVFTVINKLFMMQTLFLYKYYMHRKAKLLDKRKGRAKRTNEVTRTHSPGTSKKMKYFPISGTSLPFSYSSSSPTSQCVFTASAAAQHASLADPNIR